MENNSTQGEVKSEPSEKQHSDGGWWSRFKALGHGVLEAVGLRKENKNPLGEPYPESCHLGGETDQLATQYKHYWLIGREKLGLTDKSSKKEPSLSPSARAQEQLNIE